MKILVLLFASSFGFGLAIKETVRVNEPVYEVASHNAVSYPVTEEPVTDVLLDTVEITAVAPVTVAYY